MRTDPAPFLGVTLPRRGARLAAGLPQPPGVSLLGCAPGALEPLRNLSLAVIGCGSVGGRIALELSRRGLGGGGLLLVDPKSYKTGSLATHDIGPEDVGQPKALVVARRCKAISPSSRVLAFIGPVEALGLAALADTDLLVMAPDLLSVEVELGQRCLWLGKPLVQASVHGPTLTAQVRFFSNAKAAGGCPVCGYGRDELELMTRQVRFACDGATGAAEGAAAPATNSLGALCSLAADLAVIQILRFFLKLGQPAADTMLEYNGFTHRTVISSIARNPKCPLDHTTFARAAVDVPLASLSLAQLTHRATGAPVAPDAQFEVAGWDWVEFGACGCAQLAPLRRFVPRAGMEPSRCPKCSAPLVPLGFYTHRTVSASVLGSAIEQPLRKLGARRTASVLLRTGESGVLIRSEPSAPAKS